MNQEALITYGLAGLAAILPIAIWIYFLHKQGAGEKKYMFWAFFGGILAVALIMGLQKFWLEYPEYDLFEIFTSDIENKQTFFAITFVIVGVLEEIAKQLLVRYLDTKKAVIKSINDSIRYSFVAALGFAFAENIFYFHSTYVNYGGFSKTLLITYIFRSVFTAAGHMSFSGIFGYYYGKGRFSSNLKAEANSEGKKLYFSRFISRLFGLAQSGILRRKYITQGLMAGIILHAIFNFVLTLPKFTSLTEQHASIIAMLLVGLSFVYLYYLTKRKTGNLELLKDVSQNGEITISTENEGIILRLMGRWLELERYKDVIATADRLLKRSPNNNTAKLLKAKAKDILEGTSNVINQTIGSFDDGQEKRLQTQDKSIIEANNEQAAKASVIEIDSSDDDKFYHI